MIIVDMIESLVPEREGSPQLLLQIQNQFPSSVTYTPDCAPLDAD